MQSTDPCAGHPPGHALMPFFSRPFGIDKGGSQNPDIRPNPLFLKLVGLASQGLGVQYSPIAWDVKAHGAQGLVSLPSLPTLKINLTIGGLRAMMGQKPSRY